MKYLMLFEEFNYNSDVELVSKSIFGDLSWLKNTSYQVQKQIKYLMQFSAVRKFTILDDVNNIVYAVNKDFSLHHKCGVITGKVKDDTIKTITFTDWVKSRHTSIDKWLKDKGINSGSFFASIGAYAELAGKKISSFFTQDKKQITEKEMEEGEVEAETAFSKLIEDYFLEVFGQNKSTPAGVFKRAEWFEDKLNTTILTTTDYETYGTNYITWKTWWSEDKSIPKDKTTPIGFHGTGDARKVSGDSDQSFVTKDLNFSFGCINFLKQDIKILNQFIDYGDLTVWLPDAPGDENKILEIDKESWIEK